MPADFGRRVLRGLALVVSVALTAAAAVQAAATFSAEDASNLLRDAQRIVLQASSFRTPDGPPPAPADLALDDATREAVRYWIVQLAERPDRHVRQQLADAGAEVLFYLPNRAYLVRANAETVRDLAATPLVAWTGPYRPDYKLSPEIGTHAFADPQRPVAPGERLLVVSVFRGADVDALANAAEAVGCVVTGVHREGAVPRLLVRSDRGEERALARLEGVEWIEELGEITLRNDTTRWVAQSNVSGSTPAWDAGLHGEGQVIGHIDAPMQMESCYLRDSVDNTPGPGHRKVVAYRGPQAADAHGTHTAGTAAGADESGSLAGAGLAYAARLSHTRTVLIAGYADAASNLYDYLVLAHADDAHVHTNSWGDDTRTGYTWWCRDIDRFSRDHEDDLVVFAVTNTASLRTPENAKNVLAVGATEQAPNQEDHGSGGQGPTADGRRKPEIYLPGVGIVSAGIGACSTASQSGTSMACPAVAACGALARQYYVEGFHPSGVANPADAFVPSGALLKATLVNGGRDMTGVAGYPSNAEGWGRLLLDDALYFAGDTQSAVVKDVRNAVGLSTGEMDEFGISARADGPLRITLVFTDSPAAHAAALTPVNDLDLEVIGPDGVFLGNVFAAGASIAGGVADNLNNVERVDLPAGAFTTGGWTVRIRGRNVPDGPQGYAVHVSGLVSETTAVAASVPGRGLPDALRLAQNRPNPFDRSTSIRFALPHGNEVRLAVFDITGRLVRTLSTGVLAAGEYTVNWDGRDSTGEDVAAGIYFYRLEGAGVDETRKMVVLR